MLTFLYVFVGFFFPKSFILQPQPTPKTHLQSHLYLPSCSTLRTGLLQLPGLPLQVWKQSTAATLPQSLDQGRRGVLLWCERGWRWVGCCRWVFAWVEKRKYKGKSKIVFGWNVRYTRTQSRRHWCLQWSFKLAEQQASRSFTLSHLTSYVGYYSTV